jgi:hypothetical protein
MVYFQTKDRDLGKFWRALLSIFYGHLVYFTYGHLIHCMGMSYILWCSGIFFTVLVNCAKKNLATLPGKCDKPAEALSLQSNSILEN